MEYKNHYLQLIALVATMFCALGLQAQQAYTVYTPDDSTLTFYYDNLRSTRTGTTYDLNTGNNSPDWVRDNTNLSVTTAVFDPLFAGARPTTTASWFLNMDHLRTITGLNYLNTDSVTDMSNMFNYCRRLTSIDVSNFNTANVTNMNSMFNICLVLESLDVSSFNTANVTNMGSMFSRCMALKSLDLSSFNTANVTNMSNMFNNCQALIVLDLTGFNTANVTNMSTMFYLCNKLASIHVGSGWSTQSVTSSANMFYSASKLVGAKGTLYTTSHNDATYAHVDGGLSNPGYLWDEDMNEPYAMFTSDNSTLTFYYDDQRASRPGTNYSITTTSLPLWYTGNISSSVRQVVFEPAFANASPATVRSWFFYMINLQSITGLKYLNTENATDMYNMFYNCYQLKTADVSNFNTANVTNMSFMFANCSALESVDVSGFNTAKVTTMEGMFLYCPKLTVLDFSNFNTAKVTTMNEMFMNNFNLTTVYAGRGWSTEAVTTSSGMFQGCNKLVGGMGTTFDRDHTDAAYARIDGGTENPGYFTEKINFMRGDVNGDNDVSIADVTALIDYLLTSDVSLINFEAADCNEDNDVSIADVTALIDYLLRGAWN